MARIGGRILVVVCRGKINYMGNNKEKLKKGDIGETKAVKKAVNQGKKCPTKHRT